MNDGKIRELLAEKFAALQKRNSKYSLRRYAIQLEMSSGALSELLAGKRAITEKKARKLLDIPLFDPHEKERIAQAAGYVLSKAKGTRAKTYTRVSSAQLQVISDWWHFAILNLIRTKDFVSSPEWIAKRLGLPRSAIDDALTRLESLKFIVKKNGDWTRTVENLTTTDGRVDLAVQRGNRGLLQLALARMKTVPIPKRDVTSYVMAINPARLPEAKRAIRRMQDELSELLEGDDATEVYQLGVQLFPLSIGEESADRQSAKRAN